MKKDSSHAPDWLRRLVAAQLLGVVAAAMLVPSIGRAAPIAPPASLAQVPQFLQFPPPPNVFITVDNSGSMVQDLLPDHDGGDFDTPERTFPMPLWSPYDATGDGQPNSDLTARSRKFAGFSHHINVARMRSAAQNLIYYNPTLRYRPWKTADASGTIFSYPNAGNVALYNPFFPTRGGLDLTASTIALSNYTVQENVAAGTSGSGTYTARFDATDPTSATTPFALYYLFDTTLAGCNSSAATNFGRDDLKCYTRVEIKPSVASYIIPPGSQRGQVDEPDCSTSSGVTTCSYAAEFQNFANWFQYYRSRTLLARGAMGNAVADLGAGFRIGLGLINPTRNSSGPADGYSSTTVRLGVRDFTGSNRKPFYDLLQNHDVNSSTPSGTALLEVGNYFGWTTAAGDPVATGPWSNDPGSGSAEFAACRQSYHVYSTDGYWNEDLNKNPFKSLAAPTKNADNSLAPAEICRDGVTPAGQPRCFQYDPTAAGATSGPPFDAFGAPGPNNLGNPNSRRFVSSEATSLADIAMYFWYRDLQPKMQNIVPPSTANPAFWQNLSVLAVALGFTGTVTGRGDAFLNDLDKGIGAWPTGLTPNGNDPKTADDLWHAAVNSRGRLFVASNPQDLSNQLAAALQEIRARAAIGSAAASSTAFLDTGNGIFTIEMSQGTWSGNVYRREISEVSPGTFKFTGAGGTDANGVPFVWRASDRLPAPAARKIFTMRTGSTPRDSLVDFLPSAGTTGVDATQMADLQGPSLEPADEVINYLRGDRSKELSAVPAGTLRDRPRVQPGVAGSLNDVFGTFTNSSPIFVRDEDFNYDFLPAGTPGRDTYLAYLRANQGSTATPGRAPTLWTGSNEGMLHAFSADSGAGGGAELLAYVPRAAIPNLSQQVDTKYLHRYIVDGVPAAGDAFIAPPGGGTASWRTVVVSSLGAGGRGVFAIDATDPSALSANSVYWEVGEQSLSSSNFDLLGYTLGPPFIARVKDSTAGDGGRWVVVFGNGPESNSKRAALFVVDLQTGAPVRVLDTGSGSVATPNGLSTPAPLYDSNRQLIAVYAGDLRGNVWKFDLSGTSPSAWNVAFSSSPLFTTRSPSNVGPAATRGVAQPIFAKPLLRMHPDGGVMVLFGTGKLISPGDRESEDVQSFYGVWDMPGATGGLADDFRSRGTLVQQAITAKSGSPETYFMTSFDVPYGAGKRGWFFDLGVTYSASGTAVDTSSARAVTPRERMIVSPIVLGQNLLAQSFVPSVDACDPAGLSFLFRLKFLNGSFVGVGSFGSPQSAAVAMPGSFGLLPLIDRLASGADPSSRTGVVFAIGAGGELTGRRIDLGGLGAFRTWRQLLD